jgi:hypothetical protein
MREEIRLGNEALAHNDLETAKQHFQQLLATGGTPIQERIAANRLREISKQEEARLRPPPVRTPARRKASRASEQRETAEHAFVRPPDKPLVVIKKH